MENENLINTIEEFVRMIVRDEFNKLQKEQSKDTAQKIAEQFKSIYKNMKQNGFQ